MIYSGILCMESQNASTNKMAITYIIDNKVTGSNKCPLRLYCGTFFKSEAGVLKHLSRAHAKELSSYSQLEARFVADHGACKQIKHPLLNETYYACKGCSHVAFTWENIESHVTQYH